MRLVFVLMACVLFVLTCTKNPTDPGSPSPLDGKNGGIHGMLVNRSGRPIKGARVTAVQVAANLNKTPATAERLDKSAVDGDSVTTDTNGVYSFESLDTGSYNLLGNYNSGELVVLIPAVLYEDTARGTEVPTDTLRTPGRIEGRVHTHTTDNGGVFCYVPGTSYLAITSDTGSFFLSGIPQGAYRLTYRKDGLQTIGDSNVVVRSNETTAANEVHMTADPAYPPPAPGGLLAVYDTLFGLVRLRWAPVNVSDLAGYIIFRNDPSVATPHPLTAALVTDTLYVDTVFRDLLDPASFTYTYRVKAQDADANLSTVFSKAVQLTADSPTKVRTTFAWTIANTLGDTASIGDTVPIIVRYANPTRLIRTLTWRLPDSTFPVKVKSDSMLSGVDTLTRIWDDTATVLISVSAADEAGMTWEETKTIFVVTDAPIANPGNDTAVHINADIPFNSGATQRFGTLVMFKWDYDGDGVFDDSSATAGTTTHRYAAEGVYQAKLFVRDDDGNEAAAVRRVTVVNAPPVIVSIMPDTTVSINDSVLFYATLFDPDDAVVEVAWDFTGDGAVDYSDSVLAVSGYRYAASGLYRAVLRATDAGGKITRDTVLITVVRDVPAPNAGNDTTVSINSAVSFSGTAVQQFGTLVMFKWDYTDDGVWDDSAAVNAGFAHTYTHETQYTARFYVRDDDGNDSSDTRLVMVTNRAPVISRFPMGDTLVSLNDSAVFTVAASDSDGSISRYEWDFTGDGVPDRSGPALSTVKFKFARLDTFRVTVTVYDDDGKTASASCLANVRPYFFSHKWGSLGTADGKFNHPGAIVVDSRNNVYVSDDGNARMQKFSSTGTFLTSFPNMTAQFLDIDALDRIYLCTGTLVRKMDTLGNLLGTVSLSGGGSGFCLDPRMGDFYTTGNNMYYWFDSLGVLKGSWGALGTGDGEFNDIRGIAMNPNTRQFFICDYRNLRVQVMTNAGTFAASIPMSGGEINPTHIRIDSSGLMMLGTIGGGYRIDIYKSPTLYSTNYAFVNYLGANGTTDGMFDGNTPRCFPRNGALYTSDYGNHRVQVFK